jgi:hypothetical protein
MSYPYSGSLLISQTHKNLISFDDYDRITQSEIWKNEHITKSLEILVRYLIRSRLSTYKWFPRLWGNIFLSENYTTIILISCYLISLEYPLIVLSCISVKNRDLARLSIYLELGRIEGRIFHFLNSKISKCPFLYGTSRYIIINYEYSFIVESYLI